MRKLCARHAQINQSIGSREIVGERKIARETSYRKGTCIFLYLESGWRKARIQLGSSKILARLPSLIILDACPHVISSFVSTFTKGMHHHSLFSHAQLICKPCLTHAQLKNTMGGWARRKGIPSTDMFDTSVLAHHYGSSDV